MSDIFSARHEELAEMLRERLGDELRVVRTVAADEDEAESVHLHIREDIDETYTEEEKDRIKDEAVYHTLGEGYRSGLFRLGEPNYTVYAFDKALVILFYEDETHGTVVSVDSDFEGSVRGLASECLEILD